MDIKSQMDAATMLFKGDNYCNAYDLSYLNKNFDKLSKELQNANDIYYKPRSSRNSWFNYKKALLKEENQHLSYIQRIIKGSKEDLLSSTLDEIPEATFIDYAGYIYHIGPRDGLDTAETEYRLQNYNDVYSTDLKYFPNKKVYGLIISFKNNIRDSLITFNGLFEHFDYISNTAIIYYDNEHGFKIPRNADGTFDMDNINVKVFKWEGVIVDTKNYLQPIKREGKWFLFDEEILDSYVVIFNKVLYQVNINKYNNRYIQLTDTDQDDFSVFKLEDCFVYKVYNEDNELLKKNTIYGVVNKMDDIVYFPVDISNSMILYNGCYHDLTVLPRNKSIRLNVPSDLWVASDYSFVTATNFYYGDIQQKKCFCDHTSEYTETVSNLLLEYRNMLDLFKTKINELQKMNNVIYNDFNDYLTFNPDSPNTFKLKYFPEDISLRLFINGVRYEKDIYFYYDQDNKNIEWKFTQNNGGFDLDENCQIIAVYDFSYETNRTSRPKNFIDYTQVILEKISTSNLTLKYIPMRNTSTMFVNGVTYSENMDYTINYETKKITWTRTDEKLEASDDIEVLYEFNYTTNGLEPENIQEDIYHFMEEVEITSKNTKRHTLHLVPAEGEEILIYMNGQKLVNDKEFIYHKNSNEIEFTVSPSLSAGDKVYITYNFLFSENPNIEVYVNASNANYPTNVDIFYYDINLNNKFKLSKIAEINSTEMFVNGIKYELNKDFKFDPSENVIKWISTDFNLSNLDEVAILYNYSYSKNNMIDPNDKYNTPPTLLDIVGLNN